MLQDLLINKPTTVLLVGAVRAVWVAIAVQPLWQADAQVPAWKVPQQTSFEVELVSYHGGDYRGQESSTLVTE